MDASGRAGVGAQSGNPRRRQRVRPPPESGTAVAANTPGARVVSPYCLREAPVVVLRSPARAPCLSGSQAAFCAPPAGDTTPQPLQALPRQPTAVLLAGSDLRSALFSPLVSLPLRDLPGTIPPSRLPPRAAGPIPIPFAFFFFSFLPGYMGIFLPLGSLSASIQYVFCKNCSICRCKFDVSVGS